MGIFAICTLAGLLILALGIALQQLGVDFEIDFPIISASAVFITSFGASGLISQGLYFANDLTYGLISAGVALVLTILFIVFYKAAKKLEWFGPSDTPSSLIGTKVSVNWWLDDSGEVLATFNGQRHKVSAELDDALDGVTIRSSDEVFITAVQPSYDGLGVTSVSVTPIVSENQDLNVKENKTK